MQKTIAKGLFYAVATILILWTGSLTYAFVATALPQAHWLVPLFALVVFDVGTLAWLKAYLDLAEGSGQRALALIMCIFDFLGVGLMVLAEILLGGQDLRLQIQQSRVSLGGLGLQRRHQIIQEDNLLSQGLVGKGFTVIDLQFDWGRGGGWG